ncbi:MAG: DUF2892 domain-containing protein [Limnochordales bacterium]|nr:DUF2892 domain-containing protein [Bacillota bacterium]REJ32240.1 MAG: DUF2892 domain-containing protein [Bacillota bacterium]
MAGKADKAGLVQNVGGVDRVIRIILGIVLVILPPVLGWSPWVTALVAAVGGIVFFQGVVRHCPLYSRLGVSTASDARGEARSSS